MLLMVRITVMALAVAAGLAAGAYWGWEWYREIALGEFGKQDVRTLERDLIVLRHLRRNEGAMAIDFLETRGPR
jgi:hypothetical protein